MNTVHFKYVLEVEKTRSITQAAENLYMAQPNLSKAIKEIEESVGFLIFDRTSKGVIPTEKGIQLLQYAREITQQLDKIDDLAKKRGPNAQHFSISTTRGTYIIQAVTKMVAELDTKRDIDIKIQETNALSTIDSVMNGDFDLGIIRYQTVYENYFLDYIKEKNLCFEQLWVFENVVIMSREHPLASQEIVAKEDLMKYTEIIHGDKTVPYLKEGDVFNKEDRDGPVKNIRVYERSSQFDLLSKIPSTYMWVSPIPDEYLERYGLVLRKCAITSNKFKDVMVYRNNYKMSKYDKRFIELSLECRIPLVERVIN